MNPELADELVDDFEALPGAFLQAAEMIVIELLEFGAELFRRGMQLLDELVCGSDGGVLHIPKRNAVPVGRAGPGVPEEHRVPAVPDDVDQVLDDVTHPPAHARCLAVPLICTETLYRCDQRV